MTFYVLANQITAIFLSLHILTTLTFDSEVTTYLYGGSKDDIFVEVTNNLKTLAIKPKREGTYSNLLVITKNSKYYFSVKYDAKNPHQFIEVKDGIINHALAQKIKNKDF